MSTASHIKQMSGNVLILHIPLVKQYPQNNDVGQISEILNSLGESVKTLPFLRSTDCKDEERHFSVVNFATSKNLAVKSRTFEIVTFINLLDT
jgi:hypothetical protein